MATTAIWPVRGYLAKLVLYVENPEKTEQPTMVEGPSMISAGAQDLTDVIDYAMQSKKTVDSESVNSQRCYVSGINCTATGARDQMLLTKARFSKENGIIAYHGYQSFAPGEVTPDMAHAIGVELAEKLWGDRFEIVVATHLDQQHIHNHFLVNSVSFADGLRFRSNKTTYGQLRAESDRLCAERGLSVITQPEYGKAKQYGEWRADKEGELSWKEAIKADLDYAIGRSTVKETFVGKLEKMGYEVKWGKELSVKAPGRQRGFRPMNHFGEEYSTEGIISKLQRNYRYGRKTKDRPELHPRVNREIREKLQGQDPQSLATRYCKYYLLISHYATIPMRQLQPSLRAEAAALESLMRQAMLLLEYAIATIEALFKLKSAFEHKLTPLEKERAKLYKIVAKSDNPEEVSEARVRLKDIKSELKEIRLVVKDCDAIAEREPGLDQRIREISPRQRSERER